MKYMLVLEAHPGAKNEVHFFNWVWVAKLFGFLFCLWHPWGRAEVYNGRMLR